MMFGAIGRCPACNKYHDRCTCNGKVPKQVDNLAEALRHPPENPMKTYTLQELQALKAEYLATLDDDREDEWYTTPRMFADGELSRFFGWLNIRENTP